MFSKKLVETGIMKKIKTITANEMRGINRTAILELIRREGPTSQSYISEELNISLPTVIRIMEDLIKDELVCYLNETEWSGGRRRSLIRLNAEEHLTIGLDLGGTKFYGALIDLDGNVLFEEKFPKHNSKGEASYELVISLISKLLDRAKPLKKKIMGIGIGVPGVTYHDLGIVQWAPGLEWRDFPLRDRIQNHFNLTTIIDNDVNLSALGEMWFGAGIDVDNLVLINNGTGIGAGIVLEGTLYRGGHEMAGEIGYIMPGREFLESKYPGFGALEILASGTGISNRGKIALEKAGQFDRAKDLDTKDVFQANRNGEDWASDIVADTIDYLAIAIGTISTVFDPDVIVLGGGVSQSADLIIEPIIDRLTGRIPRIPKLTASSLGYQAAVFGAMINLLHNVSDFYVLRKLS